MRKTRKMIDKKDLKVHYSSGTGPGGQHKNRTLSHVTITYVPSGISESCQETRSKNKNYAIALERLEVRLEESRIAAQAEETNDERKAQINKGRIRTYNYPRDEVTDHRTGKKANLTKVMNGKLDLLK